ncbi:hypothetical protein ILUMI_05001 [Ignelater luminosus]|uniref:Peptidase aspartic putative domain-containing protein n=1 Tax=Ignelater luminosus TaxID=2038154 RepID=A0A8K0GKJ6_IGNLU|nr:hypothetical protein ILUMI_05001 [Ignelater luminosus]
MALSVLYDKVQSHLRKLCSLGVTVDNCAPILMPLVSSCLSVEILRTWERKGKGAGSSSKVMLESLLGVLKYEVDVEPNKGKTNNRDRFKNCKETIQKEVPTAVGLLTTVKDQPKGDCIFCSSGHRSQECIKAQDMPLAERRKIVEETKACFCYLRLSHSAKFCRNRPKCIICKKPHSPIVCEGIKELDKQKPEVSKEGTQVKTIASTSMHCTVILQTLLVKIKNGNHEKIIRALLDSASQKSYIFKSTAKKTGYLPERCEPIQHSLSGGYTTEVTNHDVYTITFSSLEANSLFEVIDHHKICGNIAPIPSGPWVEELQLHNNYLSDVNTDGAIEILLGADVVRSLLTGNRKEVRNGLIAFQTKLGWTLIGKVPNDADNCKGLSMLVTSMLTKDAKFTDLWSLDTLGITNLSEKLGKIELEAATHQHFLDSVKINEEGRREVRLPFIENHPPLSTNYGLAMKRLNRIIEEMTEELGDQLCHYLPHRHVIKLGSSTLIRPVFDAWARDHTNRNFVSLNQCLEKGPNLREKIPAILAGFPSISGKLYKSIAQDYELDDIKTVFWIDSTTVLAWIGRCEPWDAYIYNRVREIRELTCRQEWRHVPGAMNSVDLVSRGCYPKKFLSTRWWEGPSWLRQPEETWPQPELTYNEEKNNSERRENVVSALLNSNNLLLDCVIGLLEAKKTVRSVLTKCIRCKRRNVKRVYPLELELKSDKVSKAAGERLRKSVEENVTMDSCLGTSEGEEEPVKSSEVYERKTRSGRIVQKPKRYCWPKKKKCVFYL